jgi:hypothetical protein
MQSNENPPKENRPWWKQRWPWLLMSGPVIVMIASGVTIWLAYYVDADQPIHDGVVHQGLKVTEQAPR